MGTRPRLLLAVLLIATASLASTFAHAQKTRDPLTEGEVMRLLQGGVAPQRVGKLARESSIAFEVNHAVERDLRSAGADDQLLQTLRELAPGKGPAKPKNETPRSGSPAATGILLITTDAACKLAVDGEDAGELAAGASKRLTLPFGEHLIRAVSTEEPTATVEWTGRVEKAEQTLAHLKLADKVASVKAPREKAAAEAAQMERAKSDVIGKWKGTPYVATIQGCTLTVEYFWEVRRENIHGDTIEAAAVSHFGGVSPDTSQCREEFPGFLSDKKTREVWSYDRENGGYVRTVTFTDTKYKSLMRFISPTRFEEQSFDMSGKPFTFKDGNPVPNRNWTKIGP